MRKRHPRSDGSPLLLARDVSFGYDDGLVLRGVDLSVGNGEFLAVVGRSGCGKSTLLKVLAGLLPASSGQLKRGGRIRVVFQEGILLPWLTVLGNVAIGRDGSGIGRTCDLILRGGVLGRWFSGLWGRKEVLGLLAEMGMEELSGRYPMELSGGERQRVAIARAFASFPKIVLMDEPFGSLDVMTRGRLQEWLLGFWEQHRASIVFVTHDIEEALLLADRVAVLRDGRLEDGFLVDIPRPRDPSSKYTPQFLEQRRRLAQAVAFETRSREETLGPKMARE